MSGTARVTLQGRRILVTGGSKGIGREIALAAADEARGVSGKLISVVSDDWRDAEVRARLVADPDLATLRRIDDLRDRRVR